MRKYFQSAIISILVIAMASCQSKEEKAAEFIKNELSKSLYDFESYQPIETIVTEAKMTMYNDSACWENAAALAYGMKKTREYLGKVEDAEKLMDIWGRPSYYSSTYSDNQYYKYRKEYDENLEKAESTYETCKSIAAELKKQIAKLDTAKVIGWEAKHRFRCKTRGGNSTIGDYRYVFDKDFKTIFLEEDLDGEDESAIRDALNGVVAGEFDD
ncbi:hypothetical protein [Porphyromonas endodontalis]|jgi:lipoprotein